MRHHRHINSERSIVSLEHLGNFRRSLLGIRNTSTFLDKEMTRHILAAMKC